MKRLDYRGLALVIWRPVVYGWARRRDGGRCVITPSGALAGGLTLKQLADRWWRSGQVNTTAGDAIDGLPWELHAIENRTARYQAYQAYDRARR